MRKVARRKNQIVAEFAVTVRERDLDWDGLDAVLWELVHAKPKDGFLPLLRAAARRRRNLERAK